MTPLRSSREPPLDNGGAGLAGTGDELPPLVEVLASHWAMLLDPDLRRYLRSRLEARRLYPEVLAHRLGDSADFWERVLEGKEKAPVSRLLGLLRLCGESTDPIEQALLHQVELGVLQMGAAMVLLQRM